MSRASLKRAIESVEKATGPDRQIDAEVAVVLRILPVYAPQWLVNWQGDFAIVDGRAGRICALHQDGARGVNWLAPELTRSIDACLAVMAYALPGWAWKVGTCCVSDDAWVVPDFNHSEHGPRLIAQFGPIKSGSIWDAGIDIDRRPAGTPALALLLAILKAVEAVGERASR